jgi:class 3 adenylate cyclase
MEPRIQYAKASDGVSIAYAAIGSGRTLVATSPVIFSNVSEELRTPEFADWYSQLSAHRRLVRFDWRGMGMSDRDVSDFTMDRMVLDLAAVVDAQPDDNVDLLGIGGPSQEVVAYAASHPERVRRMALWSPAADNKDIWGERLNAVLSLAERDWELCSETFAHNLVGWSRGSVAHRFAAMLRASMRQSEFIALMAELPNRDISSLLGNVQSPTIVIQQPHEATSNLTGLRDLSPLEHARLIASRIPNAQIVQLGDGAGLVYESERGTRAILDFLDAGTAAEIPGGNIPSGTAIILFADIADSTALTERLGDAAFRAKARDLDTSLRGVINEHGGTCIDAKTLGDGVLATFTSASQAITAALACGGAGGEAGLPLHLGLHAGDVIREDDNVYGGAVNIAARISALSAPGEVLVSQTVRDLARTSAGVSFADRGEQALKGIEEPVRVWAVESQ